MLLTVFKYLWIVIFGAIVVFILYDEWWSRLDKDQRKTAIILAIFAVIMLIGIGSLGYWFFDIFVDKKPQVAEAATLSESKQDTADTIADICIEEWDTYGRLPSIVVGQAFVESGLGSGPNLFGVRGDAHKSIVSSTYGYLNCLNNEYFRGEGAFIFDREEQLSIIMKGGRYCEGQYPGGSYYNNVLSSIYKYGWEKYDNILTKRLDRQAKLQRQAKARRARKRHQREPFQLHGDKSVPVGTCVCDPTYIKQGSVIVVNYNILECTKTKKGLGNTILVHEAGALLPMIFDTGLEIPKECKDEVYLTEVIENAKG